MNSIEEASATTITESIQDLVTELTEGERTTFNNIFRTFDIPISDFEEYCSWSKDSYTRNCIVKNKKFELILLCWEKGQMTPIHDHGGEECWVKVINGEIRETNYQEDDNGDLKTIKSTISKTNAITYMIDFMGFHSLENQSEGRSMSLHLYAKPILKCKVYDKKKRKFTSKELVYNTVA